MHGQGLLGKKMKRLLVKVAAVAALLCAFPAHAEFIDIKTTHIDFCGPEHGDHDIGCLGLSFGYRVNESIDEYAPGGVPGADGIPDILQYMREFDMVVDMPEPEEGYRWEITGDSTFTLIMGGDLDSDPHPEVEIAPDGHYDPEWFEVTVEDDFYGRILDKTPGNDPFNMNNGKDWGCLWQLHADFCDRVYDHMNPPESPTLPSIYGETTVPAETMAKYIEDGQININFRLSSDHNDLTGHTPWYTDDEEFVTVWFRFNAEQVLDVLPDLGVPPIAVAGASALEGEAPLEIVFDASVSSDEDNDIAEYLWDFGDGETGTGVSPSHIYTEAGTYTVTLTVVDASDHQVQDTLEIVVDPQNLEPVPVINYAPEAVDSLQVNFDASASSDADGAIISYLWDFGDGTTSEEVSPSHTFAGPGPHTVILTVIDDGGKPAASVRLVVPGDHPPLASFVPSLLTAEAPATIGFDGSASSDTEGPLFSFDWNFGDGGSAIGDVVEHEFIEAGVFDVTLIVTDSALQTHSVTTQVEITPANLPPVAAFTYSVEDAEDTQTIHFDAATSLDEDGTIATYVWDFGDSTGATGVEADRTYLAGGDFEVTLTVTDDEGESHSTTQTVTVTPNPVNTSEALLPTDDIGASNQGDALQLFTSKWDHSFIRFELDTVGTNVDSATLRLYYAGTGPLTLKLWPGSTDAWNEVGEEPETVGHDYLGTPILAMGEVEGPGWIELDVSEFIQAQRLEDSVATFEVSTDSGGWSNLGSRESSFSPELIVVSSVIPLPNQAPVAQIVVDPATGGAAPLEVQFDGSTSADIDGAISAYAWDFGDGTISSEMQVSHTYLTVGTYTASLTVTDNIGVTHTQTLEIVVTEPLPNVPPTAAFTATPATGAAPLLVSFDGSSSTDSDGTVEIFEWDFGDGNFGIDANSEHTYVVDGTYTVRLTVTDNAGDTHFIEKDIEVTVAPPNVAPTALIEPDVTSGVVPLTVNFSGAGSTDADGSVASYVWDFGDSSPVAAGAEQQREFTAVGNYTVTLTVVDDDGADASTTVEIVVNEPPNVAPTAVASASVLEGQVPLTVTFDGTGSSDSDGTIAGYAWDFADGNNGVGGTIERIFEVAGTYEVSLTVTDDDGDTASDTVSINVIPEAVPGGSHLLHPVADIGANNQGDSANLPVNFWSHAYMKFDLASVTGQVSSAVLRIYTDESADLTTSLWPASSDEWDESTGHPEKVGHTWLGTELLGEVEHSLPGYIEFDVSAFVTAQLASDGFASFELSNGSGGWKDYSSREGIYPPELVIETTTGGGNIAPTAAITATPEQGAAPLDVSFDAKTSSDVDGTIASYAWDFGDGNTATGDTATYQYVTPGAYTVTLTVTDNLGAVNSTTTEIVVEAAVANVEPVASMVVTPNAAAVNEVLNFDASGSSDSDGTIASYAWDFGDGNTGDSVTAQHAYAAAGSYTVELVVTDNEGATHSTTSVVEVTPEEVGDGGTSTLTPTDDSGGGGQPTAASVYFNAWDHGFMRFDVSSETGPVQTATLRIYVRSASTIETTVWAASSDDWSEASDQPEKIGHLWYGSDPLASTSHAEIGYVEFDVTAFIAEQISGDGVASFELSNDQGGWVMYDSKEGEFKPELIVTSTGP